MQEATSDHQIERVSMESCYSRDEDDFDSQLRGRGLDDESIVAITDIIVRVGLRVADGEDLESVITTEAIQPVAGVGDSSAVAQIVREIVEEEMMAIEEAEEGRVFRILLGQRPLPPALDVPGAMAVPAGSDAAAHFNDLMNKYSGLTPGFWPDDPILERLDEIESQSLTQVYHELRKDWQAGRTGDRLQEFPKPEDVARSYAQASEVAMDGGERSCDDADQE